MVFSRFSASGSAWSLGQITDGIHISWVYRSTGTCTDKEQSKVEKSKVSERRTLICSTWPCISDIWRPNSVLMYFCNSSFTYVQHSWRWKLEERAPFYFSSLSGIALLLSQSVGCEILPYKLHLNALPLLWLPPDLMLRVHSPALSWQRWLPAVPRATIHCFGPQRSSRILSIAAKSRKSKKTGIVIQCNNVRNLLVTNQISRLSIYVFSCILK